MGGTQARLTPGNGTAATKSVGDQPEGFAQRQTTRQAMYQGRNLIANDLDSAHQRAVRVIPTGEQEQPMLYQHTQQFGRQLTQDALGFLGLPLILLAFVFPSFPHQFNLPAGSP